jgi:hypothetical protein
VILKNLETGYDKAISGAKVLVAAGRVSNADLLDVHINRLIIVLTL